MNVRIVSYEEKYDERIRELEHLVLQGRSVRLEIIKDNFLSRSVVYNKYYPCLAVDAQDTVVGIAIGACTGIIINGKYFDAGIGYDVKVHPMYRNRGIGREMAQFIYKAFFEKEQISMNFITLKAFNTAVLRLMKPVRKTWLYDFVYLTIPARSRAETNVTGGKKQLFSVGLFHTTELATTCYTSFASGLGCLHTFQMYHLKIRYISPLLRFCLAILKKVYPKKYAHLPEVGATLKFATLYNHNPQNIMYINQVLKYVEESGLNYLMVCCQKKDVIYETLKKISIDTFDYYLLSDFPLKKGDEITVDVRCL